MKILIYGAGIIGCTYGWQLSEAGHDITMMVRKGKKQQTEENGIRIHCSDFRGGKKQIHQVIFRPKVIEELTPENDFEYILVAGNCIYIKDMLPTLAKSAGKAHVVFFQNMWNDFDEIARQLSAEQYFFGFPFMAGGGRDDKSIYSVISGLKYSYTMLGEANGEITPRVLKLAEAINDAKLKPMISANIRTWLITHYVMAAALSVGIKKAGGGKAFSGNKEVVKEVIRGIREGFEVCKRRAVNPKSEKVNKLYYLPLFLSVPIARKIYSNESLCMMFDGHMNHSPDEMIRMLDDIISDGEKYNLDMPHLRSLQKSIATLRK